MVAAVLEHAMGVLEEHASSSSRKARRGMRDVSDRAELLLESIDAGWCDGVSRCGEGAWMMSWLICAP